MTVNLDSMSFGEAIKYYRKERGWMQSKFAEKSKMLVPSVSAIETNRYTPAYKTGVQLIKALVGDEGREYRILVDKLKTAISSAKKDRPYKTFGRTLKSALAAAGMTQSDLSRILQGGPSERGNTQLISAWCAGSKIPSADLMREVIKVLHDKIPRDKVGKIGQLRRARWQEIFMADVQFSDMTQKEKAAVTAFLGDLD